MNIRTVCAVAFAAVALCTAEVLADALDTVARHASGAAKVAAENVSTDFAGEASGAADTIGSIGVGGGIEFVPAIFSSPPTGVCCKSFVCCSAVR